VGRLAHFLKIESQVVKERLDALSRLFVFVKLPPLPPLPEYAPQKAPKRITDEQIHMAYQQLIDHLRLPIWDAEGNVTSSRDQDDQLVRGLPSFSALARSFGMRMLAVRFRFDRRRR